MRNLRSLEKENLKNKVCLLRLDFNTEDNWRMEASLPTMEFLAAKCRAVVILSHKGRPEGREKQFSLELQNKILSRLLKKEVIFIKHFDVLRIEKAVHNSLSGSVFLLENLRFLKEEEANDRGFARTLASLGDIYVNDAFAVSHRANASVAAITRFIDSYAGLEMEKEIAILSKVMKNPKKPLVVIIGGLKIFRKLPVFRNLRRQALVFLVGGALDRKTLCLRDPKLIFPVDFKKENNAIKDTGPKSIVLFKEYIKDAATIIWNGPVGDIGKKEFENGTREIAKSVAANKKAYKVVGGGETVMFLKKMKLDKKIDFISTGGGAMLEFLAGKKLPGIEALNK